VILLSGMCESSQPVLSLLRRSFHSLNRYPPGMLVKDPG